MYQSYKVFLSDNNGELCSQQKFKSLILEKEIFKLDRNNKGSELIYKKEVYEDYLKNNDFFQEYESNIEIYQSDTEDEN